MVEDTCELRSDIGFMRMALSLADGCRDVLYYGVGCVLVSPAGDVLATGFTGERKVIREGKRIFCHAEEVALEKAGETGVVLAGSTLYSTMEPCSERASGELSCVSRIIGAGVARVVFGCYEPYDERLKICCRGASLLEVAGLEVLHLSELEAECRQSVVAKREHEG